MAEYDTVDPLTGYSHSVSLSGVPMRPKKKPTTEDAIAALGKVLAESQDRLTQMLANAITSRPGVEPVKSARTPRQVSVTCDRNASGSITGGTASNGETTWDMKVLRSLGGHVQLDFTPR